MNLENFNSLIELFFYQSEKQDPKSIFLQSLNSPIELIKVHWRSLFEYLTKAIAELITALFVAILLKIGAQ